MQTLTKESVRDVGGNPMLKMMKGKLAYLFHKHDWVSYIGTGIYAEKRNKSALRICPVERRYCKICGKIQELTGDVVKKPL